VPSDISNTARDEDATVAPRANIPVLIDPQRVDEKVEARGTTTQHRHTLALVHIHHVDPFRRHETH
jgi:hypothetical protein